MPSIPVALPALLLLTATAAAGPITVVYSDTKKDFMLMITAPQGVFPYGTHSMTRGVNWEVKFTITEDADARSNDTLRFAGTVQHLIAPHDEPKNPNVLSFDIAINAVNFDPGRRTAAIPSDVAVHPALGHTDVLFPGQIAFTRSLTIPAFIPRYQISIRGEHSEFIPEPPSFILLASGMTALSMYLRICRSTSRCRK